MKRWQYHTESFSELFPAYLNKYGADGWELVSVSLDRSSPRFPYIVVFKREIVK